MKKTIYILSLALFFSATFFSLTLAAMLTLPTTGLPEQTIYEIIRGILLWLLGILGFIGIIGFVISGIMYLVSAGSDEAIKRAKKGMVASIIGIIVGLGGFVAIQAIEKILGGTDRFF